MAGLPLIAIDRTLVVEGIEVLERIGCQFFACPGPDAPFEDMKTCYICDFLARLRAANRLETA
jgi:hypothetical protein